MFGLLYNYSEVDANGEVEMTTAPRLISTGRSFDDIQSLVLAGEGMIVCKFKKFDIVNAVLSQIGCYFFFSADNPKGPGGQSKNTYLFLEKILLSNFTKQNRPAHLPIGVQTVVSQLRQCIILL